MNAKRKKKFEVLVSTVMISVITVGLFWAFAMIRNRESHSQIGIGGVLVGFLGGIVFGLLAMGVYIIPSAFIVSLLIVRFDRFSLRAVALLLFAVVTCSLISAYLIDPNSSRATSGAAGYFWGFDWFASRFTLTAVITGFIGSIVAFWAALRRRRRSKPVAESTPI